MKTKMLLTTCIAIATTFISASKSKAQSWSLTGNAGTTPAANFIGTTDNKNFIIRSKNIQRINITSSGEVIIGGGGAPVAKLELRNTTDSISLYVNNTSTNAVVNGYQFGVVSRVAGISTDSYRIAGDFRSIGNSRSNTGVSANSSGGRGDYGGVFTGTDGSDVNMGVQGITGGPEGSINYAVYGGLTLTDAGLSYAGYFDGPTYTKSLLIGYRIEATPAAAQIQTGLATGLYVASGYSSGNGVWSTYTGTPTDYYAIWGNAPATSTNKAGYFSGNVTITGTLTNPSDERLKENIQPLTNMMDKIMQLGTHNYNFKKEYSSMNLPQKKQMGFLAQDMEKVFPELVEETIDKSKGDKQPFNYKAINYTGMIPVLTRALQEEHKQLLQADSTINALGTTVNTLKTDNEELKSRLKAIETFIASQNSSSNTFSNQNITATNIAAKLGQNEPNPFNQRTVINYSLPSNVANAMIIVYSGNGTKIKTFGNLSKGTGQVEVTANTLSPGVYSYTLFANGKQIESKQMVITK